MMRAMSLFLVLLVVLVLAFAILNWVPITTPTAVSLGFTDVQAPLGLILLVASGILVGLLLVYIVFQQAGLIVESRRYSKEMKQQRELADRAEASRFTELRSYLEGELGRVTEKVEAVRADLAARTESSDQTSAARLGESIAGLTAHLGEMEDKLDRALLSRPGA
jgi:uncharacterized integral membrane protein